MNISHYRSAGTINIHLTEHEASQLCTWFELTTNPAPNPQRDVPGKLEDMINEILGFETSLGE